MTGPTLFVMEKRHMKQQNKIRGKVGLLIISSLFLFVLMPWIPIAVQSSPQMRPLHTGAATGPQETPTVDSTMTALEKEKLIQEVNQLKNQDVWSWANISIPFSILAAVAGAIFALIRWFADRRAERERRAEERFQAIATDLGSKNLVTQAGATNLLHTFL